MIDVCDVVRHEPSGENWVVACVDGDRLYWVGYPYGGSVALSDCQLVTKASDDDRQSLLEKLAELTGFDVPTLRARARLTQRVPDGLTPEQSEQVRQMIQNALDTGSA